MAGSRSVSSRYAPFLNSLLHGVPTLIRLTRILLIAAICVGAGCASGEAVQSTEPLDCSPRWSLRLAPSVVAVTPSELTQAPEYDWNAVADSVTYPELARRARVEGGVAATVRVNDSGQASSVEVHGLVGAAPSGSAYDMLSLAAKDGLARALYRPASSRAIGGASEIDVIVVFRSRVLPPCNPPLQADSTP